jgi:hypothetical protein
MQCIHVHRTTPTRLSFHKFIGTCRTRAAEAWHVLTGWLAAAMTCAGLKQAANPLSVRAESSTWRLIIVLSSSQVGGGQTQGTAGRPRHRSHMRTYSTTICSVPADAQITTQLNPYPHKPCHPCDIFSNVLA